ncbi:MAG: tetratricopeptide repeat protein [Planctomycetaceae bacterium]
MERRAVRLALLLPALLLLPAPRARAEEDPFVVAYNAGLQAYIARDWPKALASFDECTRLLPKNWRGYFWTALCTTEIGRRMEDLARRAETLKQAQKLTERMIARADLNYTDPLALYLEGLIANIAGDHPRAYERLSRAITCRADSFAPYAEVGLDGNVKTAYAIAALSLAQRMIMFGNWQRADEYLVQVETHLAEDHPAREEFLQNFAIVDEQMNRDEAAMARLRQVMELAPGRKEEMLAGIAVILLRGERTDEARKVLAEAGPDAKGFEIVSARCLAAKIEALRDPEGPAMDAALALYRASILALREEDTYRLVCEMAEIMDTRVHPAEVEAHMGLIREVEALLLRQVEVRPECPPAYWHLTRIYRLLREPEKLARYERLHETKKEEVLGKERFDHRGKARC